MAQQRHGLQTGRVAANGMDEQSACLVDPRLQAQLAGIVQLAGALSTLCGVRDPWLMLQVRRQCPRLVRQVRRTKGKETYSLHGDVQPTRCTLYFMVLSHTLRLASTL